MSFSILAINPGSTSTKIAVFENETEIFSIHLQHTAAELAPFDKVSDQYAFRKKMIVEALINKKFDFKGLDAVVGRGGLVRPVESGTYAVTEKLKQDLFLGVAGEHASNLGGLIADDISSGINNCKAFIADPAVVDELDPVARVSGHPLFERRSVFHALNQKAMAKMYAKEVGRKYTDLRLVVAHMGGGITIGAHRFGRVVDVNNGVDGYGPFSPERAGTIPAGDLVKLAFSNKYTYGEVKHMLNGIGGLMGHLGLNQAQIVEAKALWGDEKCELILKAMAYQVAKEIGAMATVLNGNVDAIILTGGIAHSKYIVNLIKQRIKYIAPVKVYAGEDEMKALAINAFRVLSGLESLKAY